MISLIKKGLKLILPKEVYKNKENKIIKYLKNKYKILLATKHAKIAFDIYALSKLAGLLNNYVPWTSSSMRPSAVVIILNDIIINNRSTIIEFGSGISTLYIAKILQSVGTKTIDKKTFISVDHDLNWINIVKNMLQKEGLEEIVEFVHAPLSDSKYSINNLPWYDETILKNSIGNLKFDLIIIDGPPAYAKEFQLIRYTALPFLKSCDSIQENVSIYLDDIDRKGEQKIVELWERKYGYKFARHYANGGIATCFLGASFNVI